MLRQYIFSFISLYLFSRVVEWAKIARGFFADVAQWQSNSFVKNGSRVRFPPSAHKQKVRSLRVEFFV